MNENLFNDQPRRNSWEFEWSAKLLADAAMGKKAHHEKRLAWWNDQKEQVMAEIKAKGISIDESLAAHKYVSNSLDSPRVSVDTTLARKLAEAHTKTVEHTDKVREYDGWAQVLFANQGKSLPLTAADWLYFFAK